MLLQKCHSQKVAHHIATLNESEANYVNQTKVIVYCVIAEVMGSHKQSDSKSCVSSCVLLNWSVEAQAQNYNNKIHFYCIIYNTNATSNNQRRYYI